MDVSLVRIRLVPEARAGLCHPGIVCDHHPAFASGDVLGCVERVGRGAEDAERRAGDGGADSLAGVLDQGEPVLVREARNAGISHGLPWRWTGMIALVR